MNQIKLEARLPPPDDLEAAAGKPYYEIVRDELARNIASAKLWPGLVLLGGPIATRLGVGRGPVQREGRGRVPRWDALEYRNRGLHAS